MDLSIVIPTHRRHASLMDLLDSLSNQDLDGVKIEVLVVSNLADTTVLNYLKQLKSQCFPINFLVAGKLGVNIARNLGVSKALSKYIYFLDDDVFLQDQTHIKNVIKTISQYPEAAAIGGGYFLPSNAGITDHIYHSIASSWQAAGPHLVGGNTIYNFEILQDKLHFNEKIIFGGSETELNLKLISMGKKLIYEENLSIEHRSKMNFKKLIIKAFLQGKGRSLDENIFATYPQRSIKGQKFKLLIGTPLFYIYDFFYEVGYRHSKLAPGLYFSVSLTIKCMFETFFEIDNNKFFTSQSSDIPYHLKLYPAFKFIEIHHWLKAHFWWRFIYYPKQIWLKTIRRL